MLIRKSVFLPAFRVKQSVKNNRACFSCTTITATLLGPLGKIEVQHTELMIDASVNKRERETRKLRKV